MTLVSLTMKAFRRVSWQRPLGNLFFGEALAFLLENLGRKDLSGPFVPHGEDLSEVAASQEVQDLVVRVEVAEDAVVLQE